jgi:hypothetical protein
MSDLGFRKQLNHLVKNLVKASENFDPHVWHAALNMMFIYDCHSNGISKEEYMAVLSSAWDDYTNPPSDEKKE